MKSPFKTKASIFVTGFFVILGIKANAQDTPLDHVLIESGSVLVEQNCASCHAIGEHDVSEHPDSPAFRELETRYPVEYLEEALAEGIVTGHPDMPEFKFQPPEIDAIIAYLKSIQTTD